MGMSGVDGRAGGGAGYDVQGGAIERVPGRSFEKLCSAAYATVVDR